jgi:hypothetical protein
MIEVYIFAFFEVVILFLVALFLFKSLKDYLRCLLSFLALGWLSFLKKHYNDHFLDAHRFVLYMLVVLILSYLNKYVFLSR